MPCWAGSARIARPTRLSRRDLSGGDVIATAAAVQNALDKRWSEDDYDNRLVAIACFEIDGWITASDELEQRWVRCQIRAHNGVSIDVTWSSLLVIFPRLVDAVGCATQLRNRFNRRIRTGLNLGEFLVASDGCPGSGSRFAKRLMEQSEPGGVCISCVAGEHVTSRISGDESDQNKERVWRSIIFTALQWTGLLAVFLGWSYLTYWKISHYAIHGSFPCWPQWMCG